MSARNFSKIKVDSTEASTNSSSGSIICQGGIYIGGSTSLFNGSINISGNNSFATGYGSYLTLSYTGSGNLGTGAIVSAGGGYFSNDSMFNGNLTVTGTANTIFAYGSDDAVSTGSGSIISSGGINIAKSAIIMGDMGTYTFLGGSYVCTFSSLVNLTLSNAANNTGILQLGYVGNRKYQGTVVSPSIGGVANTTATFTVAFPMTFQSVVATGGDFVTFAGNIVFSLRGYKPSASNTMTINIGRSGNGNPATNFAIFNCSFYV